MVNKAEINYQNGLAILLAVEAFKLAPEKKTPDFNHWWRYTDRAISDIWVNYNNNAFIGYMQFNSENFQDLFFTTIQGYGEYPDNPQKLWYLALYNEETKRYADYPGSGYYFLVNEKGEYFTVSRAEFWGRTEKEYNINGHRFKLVMDGVYYSSHRCEFTSPIYYKDIDEAAQAFADAYWG